jgi:hypothetical protein
MIVTVYFFLVVQHVRSLAQSCVLLGPADAREWAHKKLVAGLTAVDEQNAAILCDKSPFQKPCFSKPFT